MAVDARAPTPGLPSGTVTFLFTDVEGSTRAWIRSPEAMRAALVRHDALIESLVTEHGGQVVRPRGEGDSRFAVFARASDGVSAACAIQLALVQESWSLPEPLRVRIALHTGEADLRAHDYYGPAVNHCARLRAVAHGGQVLVSAVTAEVVRESLTGEISLRDLGQHQLKDLQQGEQVWQLMHRDLPAEFPPLSSLTPLRHNLQAQSTPFIGRRQTIEAVRARLTTEGVRLLTLTGSGGIGKTRLALQVAAEVLENFRDGVFFVPLASISEPDLLGPTIAQVLGVRETGGRPVLQKLIEQLRTKEMLLVLDNCEQLLPAAPFVAELLDACPRLSALVTSRAVLRLARESLFEVPAMAAPDPELPTELEAIGQYDAIRLFCERAKAVQPDFALSTKNAGVVVDICHRLEGLPLAIELAAARVRLFPPAALLGRLSSRLGLLTGGARDVPIRHQTLRGAIAWSYDLLAPAEQRLFERLSVFVGGFTLDAAEAVANAERELGINVVDGVSALVDQSLLRQLDGDPSEVRFGLLETIREYALERLIARGEGLSSRERHAAYFLTLTEEAAPQLRASQPEWLARLEREHDNLRAAQRWCVDNGEAELGLRLGRSVWRLWFAHGHLAEGRRRLTEVLRVAGAALPSEPSSAARAAILLGAGTLAFSQGDFPAATSQLKESLAIWRELGDATRIADCLISMGSIAWQQCDYPLARSLHAESLAIRREMGDKWGTALSLVGLGVLAVDQGDYPLALSLGEEGLAIARELGNRRLISMSVNVLGNVAWHQSDYTSGRLLLEESLSGAREIEDQWGIAFCLNNLGELARHQGEYALALTRYAESLAIERQLGDRRGIARSLGGFAGVAAAQGQADRALRLAGAAADLSVAIGASPPPAEQELLQRTLQPAQRALSQEAAAAAWAKGQAMSADQAVAYALEPPESVLPPPS